MEQLQFRACLVTVLAKFWPIWETESTQCNHKGGAQESAKDDLKGRPQKSARNYFLGRFCLQTSKWLSLQTCTICWSFFFEFLVLLASIMNASIMHVSIMQIYAYASMMHVCIHGHGSSGIIFIHLWLFLNHLDASASANCNSLNYWFQLNLDAVQIFSFLYVWEFPSFLFPPRPLCSENN